MWTLVGAHMRAFGSPGLGVSTFPWGRVTDTLENVIPCLGIRGKSHGSVRESGDSVECLEECSGARACTFGELGARGVRLECTGGTRAGAQGARDPDSASRACGLARGCAGVRAGAHYSPESDDSSPVMH
ncbi:hypothetical protein CRG98_005316 [Punica granatum]|uniref:Uncharacterized protein n=1 Tax=Punica granatum TaxID=22663 RepID=A0A2I0L0Q3_PUNGR|nr:hypothetical protein CRG98_005316 [Punica granatum]